MKFIELTNDLGFKFLANTSKIRSIIDKGEHGCTVIFSDIDFIQGGRNRTDESDIYHYETREIKESYTSIKYLLQNSGLYQP